MPLAITMASTLLAIMDNGKIVHHPSIHEIQKATSIHVLAFTSAGELLVDESEGDFSIDDWAMIFERAQFICCGAEGDASVDDMLDVGDESKIGLEGFLRSTLKEKVTSDLKWRV